MCVCVCLAAIYIRAGKALVILIVGFLAVWWLAVWLLALREAKHGRRPVQRRDENLPAKNRFSDVPTALVSDLL